MRALVFAAEPSDFSRVQRTLRSLAAAKVQTTVVPDVTAMAGQLREAAGPSWLVRAGAWQPHPAEIRAIPRSASGRPVIGLGGGKEFHEHYPSIYLDPEPATALASRLEVGDGWEKAIRSLIRSAAYRCVQLHDIHVRFHAGLRMVQLVTTIQFGGAERITLDLAEECNRAGTPTVVAALGQPTRHAFPQPPCFADLSQRPFDSDSRAEAVERLCLEWGADAVHAHLIRASEADAIRARGIPLAITVHNMPASWPAGYMAAPVAFADLLIGCAEAVSREVALRLPHTPVRTVWNGIDARRLEPVGRRQLQGELREALGWDGADFVLLAVANPRRQKRLERLPEIITRLEERIVPRRVRLLLAGEPAAGSEDGRVAMAELEAAIEEWHVRKALHWSGATDELAPLLGAADAFVSTSAIEGLSLSQLEALAAGLPVVATNVGGAAEIATKSDRMFLVPHDADAEAFANVLARLATAAPPRNPSLPRAFTRERMATRSQLLYRGMLVKKAPHRTTPPAVWLLTNNFSTGGAQTSARRLLTGLAARGHRVRAATIEEAPERPTAGRRALLAAGISILAIAPNPNPEALVGTLLDSLAADPPHAVLFWNLIAPVKVMVADALLGIPVFDISPGEMCFHALERFFSALPHGLPIENAQQYGHRLAGVAVKYEAEAARGREVLVTPVHVIPNGIPLLPAPVRRTRGPFVIGTAARLSPDKRLGELLAAVRLAHDRLPMGYELRIAGGADAANSAHFEELRRTGRPLPVKWCGHVENIAGFLADLDLFAMISEPAGCPNASLEAMAAGLPIVATDHGGAAEQVVHGLNGLLAPRGDIHTFAERLLTLANDSAMRTRMGEASRERAQSIFSLERMLDSYSALIGLVPCSGHKPGT